MRLTLIKPAQAQEQTSPSAAQEPVVPAPPAQGATTSQIDASSDSAARSSGWNDVDEWWVFILVLVAIVVLVIGMRRRRRGS